MKRFFIIFDSLAGFFSAVSTADHTEIAFSFRCSHKNNKDLAFSLVVLANVDNAIRVADDDPTAFYFILRQTVHVAAEFSFVTKVKFTKLFFADEMIAILTWEARLSCCVRLCDTHRT